MKSAPKFLVIAVMLAGFCTVANISVHGQSTLEECQAIYEVVLANRNGPEISKLQMALSSANDYLKKCSELQDQGAIKLYVTNQIPRIQERIKSAEVKAIEERFNAALKARNYDEMLSVSKELIKLDRPYAVDLMLDIASIGFDNASAKPAVNKYNDEALSYAKQAIQKMGEGKTSGNADNYGFYILYKNAKCADGKINATGWMNYTIGYITYVSTKQKNEALPYLYKASQTGCETKENPEVYRLIGAWYVDEVLRLDASRMEKIKAAGGIDTQETLSLLALERGYSERAMDAYSRAYKTASDSKTASQSYKDALLTKLKEVYGVRYDDDMSTFDLYLKQAGTTPFIDPATPVTPIVQAPVPTAATEPKTQPKAVTAPSQK